MADGAPGEDGGTACPCGGSGAWLNGRGDCRRDERPGAKAVTGLSERRCGRIRQPLGFTIMAPRPRPGSSGAIIFVPTHFMNEVGAVPAGAGPVPALGGLPFPGRRA